MVSRIGGAEIPCECRWLMMVFALPRLANKIAGHAWRREGQVRAGKRPALANVRALNFLCKEFFRDTRDV
jgi:hypothetical protein